MIGELARQHNAHRLLKKKLRMSLVRSVFHFFNKVKVCMASAAQELSYACVITMFKQLLSKCAVARNSALINQEDSSDLGAWTITLAPCPEKDLGCANVAVQGCRVRSAATTTVGRSDDPDRKVIRSRVQSKVSLSLRHFSKTFPRVQSKRMTKCEIVTTNCEINQKVITKSEKPEIIRTKLASGWR